MINSHLNYIVAQQRVADQIRAAQQAQLVSDVSPRKRHVRRSPATAPVTPQMAGSTAQC